MARKMKKFAQGGDATQQVRYNRKIADINSDYQKALRSGKDANIAKAKYEQRMADAADDLAKWTRSDRTQTRAAERAAEMALSQARRTQGRSIADRDLGSRINPTPEKPMDLSGIKTDLSGVKTPSLTTRPAAATAPRRRPAATATASVPRTQRAGVTYSGDALTREQKRLADRERMRRLMGRSMTPGSAPEEQPRTTGKGVWEKDASGQYVDHSGSAVAERTAHYPNKALNFLASAIPGVAATRAAKYLGSHLQWKDDTEGEDTGYRKGGTAKKKPAKKMAKGGAAKKAAKKPVKKSCGGGMTKRYAKGGSIDGCAIRGKTRAPLRRK